VTPLLFYIFYYWMCPLWGLDPRMPKDVPTQNRRESKSLPPERPAEPMIIPTPTKPSKD